VPAWARSALIARFGRAWKFFCPVCEDKVPGFSPLPDCYLQELEEHGSDLGTSGGETCNTKAYQCPHCGATDRDRLYALYLADRLPPTAAQQSAFCLLEIAPAAPLSKHIRRNYRICYRTADLFQKHVDDRVDITAMDCYANATFDAFICSHVLEHVNDDRKAMAELWRVLKPGGWGIAMVPILLTLQEIREDPTKTSPAERWKHFGQGDHVRLYSRDGFTQRLCEAGFVVRQFGQHYFKIQEMSRCGLSATSVLYVVEKPGPSPNGH
jgi:SAM-dependent methyltransferase